MKELTFLRHPKSKANVHHIIGDSNVGLSNDGKRSVEQRIKKNDYRLKNSIIISSTYRRCRETADLITDILAIKPILHPGFNERNFGDFTGGTKPAMIKTLSLSYPDKASVIGDDFSMWMDQECYDQDGMPLFESNESLKNRILLTLDEVSFQYSDQNIIVITSTGVIRVALSIFIKKTAQEIDQLLQQTIGQNKIPNLSETKVIWENSKWKLQTLAEVRDIFNTSSY